MRRFLLPALIVLAIGALFVIGKIWQTVTPPVLSFTEECLKDGNMWHEMEPRTNGVTQPGEKKPGCMTADGMQHFSDVDAYRAAKNPGESVATFAIEGETAGTPSVLQFSLRGTEGAPIELFREHERFLHVIIVSKDMSVFSHVHPEEQVGFDMDSIRTGDFSLQYTFPRAGEYIVAIDYANQLRHESRQFHLTINGAPQQDEQHSFSSPQHSGGMDVSLDHMLPLAKEVTTLRFTFEEAGTQVTDLSPYLAAAMHVAIVKNDLTEFIHTHGEVHPPGYVAPVTLSHVHVPPPQHFGPQIEAHAIFPSSGTYTVFTEVRRGNRIIPTAFTVQVEY